MMNRILSGLVAVLMVAGGGFARTAAAADMACGPGEACPMHGPQMMQAGGAALGITIADGDDSGTAGSVEGVEVIGVMPGGGAASAGIKVGDLITAVNKESLAAPSRGDANRKLVRFMRSVNPGDEIKVSYQRDGRKATASVETGEAPPRMPMMGMHGGDGDFLGFAERMFGRHHGPLAGLDLADLNKGLGRYFGTDAGVLVLARPAGSMLPLEDGDVILRIGDRQPTDAGHARRILDSYAPGESITLEVMRDRKKKELKFALPAEADQPAHRHRGGMRGEPGPRPAKPLPRT
jgi:S1-C subfamily serine protease